MLLINNDVSNPRPVKKPAHSRATSWDSQGHTIYNQTSQVEDSDHQKSILQVDWKMCMGSHQARIMTLEGSGRHKWMIAKYCPLRYVTWQVYSQCTGPVDWTLHGGCMCMYELMDEWTKVNQHETLHEWMERLTGRRLDEWQTNGCADWKMTDGWMGWDDYLVDDRMVL